jgi:DNA-binding HxlR family transcriptional regulator
MGRTADYSKETCSIAATLEVVGDPWTLLILRDAFRGVRRFEQWQEGLGVARNVLAARLKSLVEFGVFEQRRYSERPPRHEYVLTAKGRALSPVLLTMSSWGDAHVYGEAGGPIRFQHGDHTFEPQLVCACCGQPPHAADLQMELKDTHTPTVGEALAKTKVA